MENASEQTASVDHDPQRLRQLVQRLSELIATFEVAEHKIRDREQQLEAKLLDHEQRVNTQISDMRAILGEFESVMTDVGIARWRLAAENSLKEGQEHVKVLNGAVEEFRQLSGQSSERLDRATTYAVKGVSEAMDSIRIADFKRLAEESCQRVEFAATTAVKNIAKVARWFYWKKLVMVFTFSAAVAVIFGLYINAEWPWEMHRDVVHQRELGRTVQKAWPLLSSQDKQIIAEYSNQQYPKGNV